MRFQSAEADSNAALVNESVLQQLAQTHGTVKAYFPEANTSFFDVLRWPGVVEKHSVDMGDIAICSARYCRDGSNRTGWSA